MSHLLPPDPLDPEAPGLDDETRRRRQVLAEMRKMSPEEFRDLAVRAGILTPEGELTEPYKDDSPSPYREFLSGSSLDFPILDVLRSPDIHRPLSSQYVAEKLGQRWAVSRKEVLVRLRRMANAGFVEELDGVRFAVTEKGRTARPAR